MPCPRKASGSRKGKCLPLAVYLYCVNVWIIVIRYYIDLGNSLKGPTVCVWDLGLIISSRIWLNVSWLKRFGLFGFTWNLVHFPEVNCTKQNQNFRATCVNMNSFNIEIQWASEKNSTPRVGHRPQDGQRRISSMINRWPSMATCPGVAYVFSLYHLDIISIISKYYREDAEQW